nr:serine/threonine-protein kinase [Bifidobacterium sp. DSM 109957]
MHAMSIDDAYHVEQVLARGSSGVTELVSIAGTGPFVRKKIPTALARRNVWSALAECQSPRLPHVEATYELPDCFVVIYDFVPGKTLEQLVEERGRIDATNAIRIIDQVCEATQALHEHGIVHRDISPRNIIIAPDGAHLIDLGIARMRTEKASRDTTTLGTWGFASPEQYGFAQTDARSDVYSIGRLLGYLLTGAYPGESAYDKLVADESLVPARLRATIERACAFEPSARQQSAEHLRLEMHGQPIPNAAKRSRSRIAFPLFQHNDRRGQRWTFLRGFITVVAVMLSVSIILTVAGVAFSMFAAEHFDDKAAGSNTSTSQSNSTTTPKSDNDKDSSNSDGGSSDNNDQAQSDHTDNPVKLVESGWSVDDSGYVHYAIGLNNTSDTMDVVYPTVTVVGRAKDGTILFTQDDAYPTLAAGKTAHYGGQAGQGTAPDSVEFIVQTPVDYNLVKTQPSPDFTTTRLAVIPDDFGNVTFTGEISVDNNGYSPSNGQGVWVYVTLRGKDGQPIYAQSGSASWPADDGTSPFSVTVWGLPDYASYDISVYPDA